MILLLAAALVTAAFVWMFYSPGQPAASSGETAVSGGGAFSELSSSRASAGSSEAPDSDGSVTTSGAFADSSSRPPSSSPANAARDYGENLMLVNKDHPLPEDFQPDLSDLKKDFTPKTGMKFDARAIAALQDMCIAAKADGVSLSAISAYRSYDKQTSLYNNKVDAYLKQGYEQEEAMTVAATVVARPGTSEHHTGLAVDFNSVEQSFENTKASKWLIRNAENFGFILRYPKNKQSITAVIYEPWHYRFVGVKHAKAMNQKGMCLEEYLEDLQSAK